MSIEQENKESQKLLYETRSEEVQEIMGRMPSWLLRYGIMVVGAILCLILFGAYFIKMPDKVMVSVSITSDNPPVRIISEKGGRIKTIQVHQNDTVNKEDILLILNNGANYDDIQKLKNSLKTQLQNNKLNNFPKNKYQLGELQKGYEELLSSIEEWQFYTHNDNSYLSIAQLEKQISENNNLNNQLVNNELKIKENSSIDHKIYETDKRLYQKKILTENDYLLSKRKWIDQQMTLNTNKNNIINNTLKQSELRKSILDVKQQKEKTLFEYKRKVNLSMQTLLLQIEEWEKINI